MFFLVPENNKISNKCLDDVDPILTVL